jgi:hypothetical protein
MLPKHENLVLKDKFLLYNNIAKINDCEGRLLAELQVFPSVRLTFEFEILGKHQYRLPCIFSDDDLSKSIIGNIFEIKKPFFNRRQEDIGPQVILSGIANESTYGDIGDPAHLFKFYLPNCRVQCTSGGQNYLNKIVEEDNTGQEVFRGQGHEGKYIEFSLDEKWNIRLDITKNVLDWLDSKNQNIGTLITTAGKLYQPGYDYKKPETCLQLEEIKSEDAVKQLNNLSLLLSFANGGFVSPLYIEGSKFHVNFPKTRPQFASVRSPYQITPIEHLGTTWVTEYSDLEKYLTCLNSFAIMQQQKYWRDTFEFVLIQYFQAVRYNQYNSSNTHWPIQASSLGAALERLSYTILVEEETNIRLKSDHELLFDITKGIEAKSRWRNLPKYKKSDSNSLSSTGIRLSLLLEKIGLISDINPDNIQIFLNVRNDAVHPKQGTITQSQRDEMLGRAMMWVDEILLWRLGYDGEYLDRSKNWRTSISPRFNLTTRDPSW